MEVVEDVAESGLESASIGQAASRLFVDEDPDLVVDAPWLVDLGQQTRRARPKSCLRRRPRAWRQRSKPWVLMALTGVKCDTVALPACRALEFSHGFAILSMLRILPLRDHLRMGTFSLNPSSID